MSEYRERARAAVLFNAGQWAAWMTAGSSSREPDLRGALDRLVEVIASEERLAAHLEWHCGHGECEHVDVLRQRVLRAQAAIDAAAKEGA